MDNRQIIGFRYAYFLVRKHKYRLLTINQEGGDIFLVNPSDSKYPIIRIDITGNPLSIVKINELKQFMSIQQTILRGQTQLLTLALGGEPETYDDHEVVVVDNGVVSDVAVAKHFRGIEGVSWVVKDFKSDLAVIVEKLNLESRRQSMSKGLFSSIKDSKAVMTFAIISIVFYALTMLLNTITKNPINSIIILGGFYKPFVTAGYEVWRFLTAGFLHADFLHLLTNLLALNNIGLLVERIYGTKKIIITVLVSIIVGHFFVYIGETNPLTIGLSGGVYGIFGLLLVYFFESGLIKTPRIRSQLWLIITINLLLNFMPSVSWLGHLGGFITGILLGLLYSKLPKWKAIRDSTKPAIALLIIMLVAMAIFNPTKTELFAGTDKQVLDVLDEQFGATWYTEHMRERLMNLYESRGLE